MFPGGKGPFSYVGSYGGGTLSVDQAPGLFGVASAITGTTDVWNFGGTAGQRLQPLGHSAGALVIC